MSKLHSCLCVVVKSICIPLQVKAEEVDLQATVPLSDNLIDFTDPTPVVRESLCSLDYQHTVVNFSHEILNPYTFSRKY